MSSILEIVAEIFGREPGDHLCREPYWTAADDEVSRAAFAVIERFGADEYARGVADSAAEIAKLSQTISDLLCRIHRDGGHYEAEHGTDIAVDDADVKVAETYAEIERLEADTALLRECLVMLSAGWPVEFPLVVKLKARLGEV